jgi:hypothetical protein
VLNVWKYSHSCENLTFIGYLCEICSMCENMTICVNIWLSLDICVKYAQCVKIWPFVWKFNYYWIFVWNIFNVWKYAHLMSWFCFWSVQFLKPCVMFLMDTILNLAIIQFLVKQKGDAQYGGCASLLLNCIKKTINRTFSTGPFLHRTPVPI